MSPREPIKLLVICGSLRVGGAEMQAARMLPRLDRSLFDLEVAYYNYNAGPPKLELERQGIPVRYLGRPTWDRPAYLRDAFNYMRSKRFDLVHAWSASANHYGRFPALLAGVPVVLGGLRGKNSLNGLWPFVYSGMNLVCDGWIVNSDALKEYALDKMFLNRFSPVVVVENGIDLEQDRARLSSRTPAYAALRKDRPVVGLVARLNPVKNHTLLLEAAASLRAQGVLADYWLIGDGPDRDAIAQKIHDLQLDDCVRMLGQRDDVEAAYEVMDIAVLTSDSEGCPNALLEAMRASLPIISTQCTSLNHITAAGVNGFVVPVGAVRDLAEQLKVLIHDASLRRQFGHASRSMVEKTFGMPVAVRRLEQTYLHFLKQGMVKHAPLHHKLSNLDVL